MPRRTKKAPSLTARLADAGEALNSGLALFEDAAMRLDAAQAAHDAIADEALAEAGRLMVLATKARDKAARSERAAEKVRDLTA